MSTPTVTLEAVHAENVRLRELLAAVAQDLERIAGQLPPKERELVERRAMRIRQRLHEG